MSFLCSVPAPAFTTVRRLTAAMGGWFLLLSGTVWTATVAPASAQVQCVQCTATEDCDTDVTATACYCTIRYFGSTKICREHDFCDFGCDGPPPELRSDGPEVSYQALAAFHEEEPLLAALLVGSLVNPDERPGRWILDTGDYGGGTLSTGDGEQYTHQGSFERRDDGVRFLFTVRRPDQAGERIRFVGVIRQGGRQVEYVRVEHPSGGGEGTRVSRSWSFNASTGS